jgi:hypothetical protein
VYSDVSSLLNGTPPRSQIDGLIRTGREEGISGLWKGLGPNLMLVSNPTVHYFIYDRVKIWADAIALARGKQLNAGEIFVMGAIAKCIATIVVSFVDRRICVSTH